MKRGLTLILALLLTAAVSCGMASGQTLRVFTPFADMDPGAQLYIDTIDRWEAETGNAVEDFSGLQDEEWMNGLRQALDEGTADVVVLPVGTGMTGYELVSAQELLSAAPQTGVRVLPGMAEKDGTVLLAPLRLSWESLYVNVDVFTSFGLTVPATFDDLIIACLNLSQNGVLPIANALGEWPEIVLDCAALMGAPAEAFGTQASLDGAASVLSSLSLVGAFGQDPLNATDAEMEQAFLSGAAAMRFDTSDLAARIVPERQDLTGVLFLPGADGQLRAQLPGTSGYGVALTRSCMAGQNQEAGISLLGALCAAPFGGYGMGRLAQSTNMLNTQAADIVGTLYDHDPEHFEAWAEQLIASLMN